MRELRSDSRDPAGRRLRRGLLLAAAVGFGILWICVVALASGAIHGGALIALGSLGVLLTGALLPLLDRQEVELQGLADTDALTGLANHRAFHAALEAELQRAKRDRRHLAVIALDLDNFQAVNDLHGHPFGDEVLSAVGEQLHGVVRKDDVAARTAGEEFALLLPGADGELAYRVAERAREAVAGVEVPGLELSASAGVATFPADAEDASSLSQLAAGALYWAKRRGKHRTGRFDPGHVPLAWTEQQASEVRALLGQAHPIRSVFQPVVALASGHLVGYEALARFTESSGRSREAWFAQAHGCGLGPELEAAAIRAALEPVGRPPDTHLALNISPSAMASDPVIEVLPTDLTGIVIEVTEHEFVPDDDTLTSVLAGMRERGARIAIDDAGAGYAGLRQVMRVRPDIVKLDRELTRDIHADLARMALIESFVRFARRIGATVCAEGVESLDEVPVLGDLDVQWGQGYALAPPAEPWASVSPVAAEVCRAALTQTLRTGPPVEGRITAGDRRLEHLSARLAGVRSPEDLEGVLALIAGELHADNVCLSRFRPEEGVVETLAESEPYEYQRFSLAEYPLTASVLREQVAAQVLVSDPDSDPSEVKLLLAQGRGSMLITPVVSRGESLGTVEAYSETERPWTRTEINRARIIANQFGSVIQAVFRSGATSIGQQQRLR